MGSSAEKKLFGYGKACTLTIQRIILFWIKFFADTPFVFGITFGFEFVGCTFSPVISEFQVLEKFVGIDEAIIVRFEGMGDIETL